MGRLDQRLLCWARTLKTPGLALGEFTREL
jgi:hypothetical protein